MLPFIERYKKQLILGYILLLVFSSLFIYTTLNTTELDVDEEKNNPPGVEVKPVKVQLSVQQDATYSVRMKNVDSVLDLLEELRLHHGFWYEKTAYTYGTEINEINHIEVPEGYRWAIFLGNEDITYRIGKINLEDKQLYEIKLVRLHAL